MTFSEAVQAAFPPLFLFLFLAGAVVTALGFVKFVYFLSVGYGLSIAALAVVIGAFCFPSLSLAAIIQLSLLLIYGARLGGFLLARELKFAAYKVEMDETDGIGKRMTFPVKAIIWLACAFLYCAQVSPALYRAVAEQEGRSLETGAWILAGILIMAAGVLLEALADRQKSRAKRTNPKRFCSDGLYKYVRFPNYLGEILFWTGMAVSGADIYHGWAQWTIVLLGYGCILYVMLDGAKRLEAKQNERYGADEEYKRYIAFTPKLFPSLKAGKEAHHEQINGKRAKEKSG
jgi:steroid 5-alpha reductase family enzyme